MFLFLKDDIKTKPKHCKLHQDFLNTNKFGNRPEQKHLDQNVLVLIENMSIQKFVDEYIQSFLEQNHQN